MACARYVATVMDRGTVAFEQSWRAGRSIYLPPEVRMLDIDTASIADPAETISFAREPDVRFIGLRRDHAERHGYADRLGRLGFAAVDLETPHQPEYVLFEYHTTKQ